MADHKIKARLGLDKKEFDDGLKGASSAFQNVSKQFSVLGASMIAAFSVTTIANFTKEAVKLASTAEGVKKGFENIANPRLLDDLRRATRGAVSDLQLMQVAVKASNFQIPLEQLSSLLSFASARALQTGESIDYLTDSIVLGIGRKSPLILDNLGISAVRLRQVLKGAGVEMSTVGDVAAAVGKIASEEMKKMGDVADTTATKLAQISVGWKKIKEEFGQTLIESGLGDLLQNIATSFEIWNDPDTPLFSFKSQTKKNLEEYRQWKKFQQEMQSVSMYSGGESTGGPLDPRANAKRITTLASLNEELKYEKELLEQIDIADTKAMRTQQQVIIDLEKRIKSLTELKAKTENPLISKIRVGPGLTEEVDNSYKEMIQQFYDFQKVRNNMAPGPEVREGTEDLTRALNIQWETVNILNDAFYNLFTSTGDGFKDMANAIINSIQRIAAEMAAKAAIFGLIRLLFPGSDLAVGATKGLWSMFGINGFATGGMVYGPQLAMVGENSSRSNPEVIAPLDKLVGMMGNNIKVEVVGTISARDIKLSNRRS